MTSSARKKRGPPVEEGAAVRKALPVKEGPPRVGSKAQGGRYGRGGFVVGRDGRLRCRQAARRRGGQEARRRGRGTKNFGSLTASRSLDPKMFLSPGGGDIYIEPFLGAGDATARP